MAEFVIKLADERGKVQEQTHSAASADELKQRYDEAIGKFKEVADKFPEFERANHARLGAAVCLAQLNKLDDAAKLHHCHLVARLTHHLQIVANYR